MDKSILILSYLIYLYLCHVLKTRENEFAGKNESLNIEKRKKNVGFHEFLLRIF